jgi:hypothetical protein
MNRRQFATAFLVNFAAVFGVYFLICLPGEGPPWLWKGQTWGFFWAFLILYALPSFLVLFGLTIAVMQLWCHFQKGEPRSLQKKPDDR